MKHLKIFFIFSSFILYCAAFCNSDSKNVEVKLKNDILCHYKMEERPKQLNIPVELSYGIRSFTFEEETSTLTVESKILHRWEDLRLKWEENEYAGIKMIHINSDKIWIPRLFINDSFHHYGLGECHPTECILKSSGQVGCWIPCVQQLDCDANYQNWPFDSHICRVVFKTFYTYEDVIFDQDAISGQFSLNMNNEWKLSNMTGIIDPNDKMSVKFSMKITRYSGILYKHVIIPIYCLIFLTLTILWIKTESFWRLILAGLNIYLHFSLMDRVCWQFPTNGASYNVPNVLKSMIFMLILSTIILIESIILRLLFIRYSVAPIWTQKIVNISDSYSIIKYVMLSPLDSKEESKIEENVTSDESKKKNERNVMESFNRIIDRILFVTLSIFYLFYNIF